MYHRLKSKLTQNRTSALLGISYFVVLCNPFVSPHAIYAFSLFSRDGNSNSSGQSPIRCQAVPLFISFSLSWQPVPTSDHISPACRHTGTHLLCQEKPARLQKLEFIQSQCVENHKTKALQKDTVLCR